MPPTATAPKPERDNTQWFKLKTYIINRNNEDKMEKEKQLELAKKRKVLDESHDATKKELEQVQKELEEKSALLKQYSNEKHELFSQLRRVLLDDDNRKRIESEKNEQQQQQQQQQQQHNSILINNYNHNNAQPHIYISQAPPNIVNSSTNSNHVVPTLPANSSIYKLPLATVSAVPTQQLNKRPHSPSPNSNSLPSQHQGIPTQLHPNDQAAFKQGIYQAFKQAPGNAYHPQAQHQPPPRSPASQPKLNDDHHHQQQQKHLQQISQQQQQQRQQQSVQQNRPPTSSHSQQQSDYLHRNILWQQQQRQQDSKPPPPQPNNSYQPSYYPGQNPPSSSASVQFQQQQREQQQREQQQREQQQREQQQREQQQRENQSKQQIFLHQQRPQFDDKHSHRIEHFIARPPNSTIVTTSNSGKIGGSITSGYPVRGLVSSQPGGPSLYLSPQQGAPHPRLIYSQPPQPHPSHQSMRYSHHKD